MLLMHVTKDNKCSLCGAGVIKCANEKCQQFFNPKNSRHIYHSPACKMDKYRERKRVVEIE